MSTPTKEPSLLDDDAQPSKGAITLPVTDTDARTAVWLGHSLTRKLAAGGVAAFVALFSTAAGLWGNAQLEATRGVRSDVQALVQRLDRSDERLQVLAVDAAGRDVRVTAVEARLTAVEAKCDAALSTRYGHALDRYEQREKERHGTRPDSQAQRQPTPAAEAP